MKEQSSSAWREGIDQEGSVLLTFLCQTLCEVHQERG